ncbi:MAG: 2-5 ligase family protein [Chitinophagaceae bacterium]|nr:2-5 ligase family protein [Chitinophagaceae bacterium]
MILEFSSSIPQMDEIYNRELYEYLLVAQPGVEVYEKVMAEKQCFYDEYREKIAISTRPHITVANFLAMEAMEDTIIRWMQRICSTQKSFMVTLNNYSGFPPHTIYLRVQNATPFQQLAKELKVVNTYVSSCSCPPMKLISNPHITIAARLPEEVYLKALTKYAHKSFHESFVVSELLLLRRRHQYDICKPINVFGLQPGGNQLFN